MGSLFERITDWIKEGLIDAITGQYTSIFNSVNNQVADVANQVGQDFPEKNGCRDFCPFTLRSGGFWQRFFGVP